MLIGQTIYAGKHTSTGAVPTILRTAWVGGFGNQAVILTDLIAISPAGIATLTVEVETKNSEDADSGAVALGSASATATGPITVPVTGIKELMRVKYTLTYTSAVPVEGECCVIYAHLRPLNPAWYTN